MSLNFKSGVMDCADYAEEEQKNMMRIPNVC